MSIAEQILRAKADYDEVYASGYEKGKAEGGDTEAAYNEGVEAGKQAERDRFWDTYQDYGNRAEYGYAFGGIGWVKTDLLPPKYPIILNNFIVGNYGIFRDFNKSATTRYDMTEICRLLDCSNAVRLNGMFSNSCVENVTIDMSNCQVANDMFSCNMGGGDIDKIYLKVTEKLTSASSMFASCNKLETIRFTEDSVINVALSFAQSSKLTDESVDSIVNALKDLTGATSKTLTVHATVYDRMVELGKDALVTAKNWILAKA